MTSLIGKSKEPTLFCNVVLKNVIFLLYIDTLVGMQKINCPNMIKQNQKYVHFLDFVYF